MLNILVIHYNTPKLTECLVKSINKFVGANCCIYVFDNSDKNPFTFKQDNITVFDNTRGQIINFDNELKKYPNHKYSLGSRSHWGSFKHCISIEKCFDLIGDDFILLDSDVLLKKDINELFNDEYVSCGEPQDWSWGTNHKIYPVHRRLLPFLNFINVKYCKKHNIHYYNPDYMDGLYDSTRIGASKEQMERDSYDTGCWFFSQIPKDKIKEIKCNDYIVHFRGASYTKLGRDEKLTQEQWLAKYKDLYNIVETTNIKPKVVKTRCKNVVYTCITGGYDGLIDPSYVTDGFDYVCFTDNPEIHSNIWEIREIPKELSVLDNKKINRYIKTHPHEFFEKYDTSIYVDGSILIKNNLNTFLLKQCNTDDVIFIARHPARDCLYREANVCVSMKKEKKEIVQKQIKRYEEEKFPKNYGLTQNNIIVRKHNDPRCIHLMKTWWEEIKNESYRDQLSFMYALWKTPEAKLKQLDSDICNSTYFKWYSLHNWKPSKRILQHPAEILQNKTEQVKQEQVKRDTSKLLTNNNIVTTCKPRAIIKKQRIYFGSGLNW